MFIIKTIVLNYNQSCCLFKLTYSWLFLYIIIYYLSSLNISHLNIFIHLIKHEIKPKKATHR